MKKMLDSYGARVLALLLCLFFGLGTAACAAGAVYDYYEPGMDGERDFAGSELAWDYANSQMWNALHIAYYSQTEGAEYYPPDPEDAFSYVIRDPLGNVVADTRRPDSQPVTHSENWEINGYTGEAYINLPVSRGSVLYGYVTLYDILYNGRIVFLPLAVVQGILTVLLFVFLMAAAGRTPEGVKLGGFHRWPLEIYLLLLAGAGTALAWLLVQMSYRRVLAYFYLALTLMGACMAGIGLAVLLACMTLAARFRAGKWWRNTVVFFCLKWCWRLIRWLWKWCWKLLGWVWRLIRGFFRGIGRLVAALPLAWKSVLAYGGFVLLNAILVFGVSDSWHAGFYAFLLLLLDGAGLLAVIWVTLQLKKLQTAGRALAAGDLSVTVDTKRMLPVLKEHAENLSAVSLGMTKAVNERMKSERFKTELITNVSHDLKTPLTSIVSYVDLLKKEEIDNAQAREYIQVLDRQSQRLKKLTTDLVEASKASSGVLSVNSEPVDLVELLRQSAGEYAERFALAGLEPVLNVPEGESVVTADGRLLWRVLDNLLTNVVKYALPGTRVYMDLTRTDSGAVLSLKNISREALNIPAEELMERFVRGDASRSTDGSGLGLSIARSLMELMGGQLRLTLDGDLFKAELIFT